jgi:lipopolysaccharide export system protein LptA
MTAMLASGRKANRLKAMEKGALTTFGRTPAYRRRTFTVLIVALATAAAGVVAAQPKQQPPGASPKQQQQQPSGPPNALQGFSQNRDQPVKINADELEVHDKDKMAVFSGGVHLVQGDTTMRSSKLVVFYDDQPPPPAPPPKSGKGAQASAQITPQQNQQIKRVEAKGSVIVTQKDQTATGDEGIFDMRANTVTMQGNVLISQGGNVIKGNKLVVNMTTGDAAVTAGATAGATCDKPPCGRVTGTFLPGSMKQGPDGGGGLFPTPGRKP